MPTVARCSLPAAVAAALTVTLALVGSWSHAAALEPEARRAPTVSYRAARDLPLSLAALAVSYASDVVGDELEGPRAVGDVDSVFVLDRFVARRVALRPGARTASDVLLVTGVAGGLVASAFTVAGDAGPARRRARLTRFGLAFEALALTNAATTLTKLAVRRPRPLTYAPDYDPATGRLDDQLSYFSGHTSSTASALASLSALTFVEPMPRAARAGVLATAVTWTATVGALRVRAGKHFPTDVLTGAVVGASIGALVPLTHRVHLRLAPHVGPSAAGLDVVGVLR